MAQDLDLDGFLNDKSSGGGAKYLSKWKDRDKHCVDVVFHRGSPVATKVHRHGLYRLVPTEDKKTRQKVINVWSDNVVCIEPEDVLRRQNKRDENDERVMPPTKCPICKMIEHIRKLVRNGELSWTDPVFRFVGSTDTLVLHAGGLYGAFGARDLSDEEKASLREAKISPKEAWKESTISKVNYIFRVAEYGKPDLGIQIAVETGLLGDAVKKVIRDKIEAEGDDGNPIKHPYVVRWKYYPDETDPKNKYGALAMPKLEIEDDLLKLITEAPSPDISSLTDPPNWPSLRSMLEDKCLIDLPWDDLFRVRGGESSESPSTSKSATKQVKKEPEEEQFACDECGKAMAASAKACPHCGHKYDVEAESEPEPEPAPPPLRKRSEVSKAKLTKPSPAEVKQTQKAKHTEVEADADEEAGDDLPF